MKRLSKKAKFVLVFLLCLLILNYVFSKNYKIGYTESRQTGYGDVTGVNLHFVAMESPVGRFETGKYFAFIPMNILRLQIDDDNDHTVSFLFIGYKILYYKKEKGMYVRLTFIESLIFEANKDWVYK